MATNTVTDAAKKTTPQHGSPGERNGQDERSGSDSDERSGRDERSNTDERGGSNSDERGGSNSDERSGSNSNEHGGSNSAKSSGRHVDKHDADHALSTNDPAKAAIPTVSVRGVSREFDGRGVLHDINFDIADGEFVALLGRSGSGKSTLLRILARLDEDYTGEIAAPKRPAVAFQDSRLLPWKRVLDNILLGLPTRGAEGAATRKRARDMLAEVGLENHERAWPKTLSGGEAQRASLARALVRRPELLLMDEPFGALDALTRLRMHQLLRTLRQRHRPALLLVTHDIDEAVLLADRVLVLTDGVLSLDIDIPFPVAGRRRRPEFAQLRDRLLDELGVPDDDR